MNSEALTGSNEDVIDLTKRRERADTLLELMDDPDLTKEDRLVLDAMREEFRSSFDADRTRGDIAALVRPSPVARLDNAFKGEVGPLDGRHPNRRTM